MKSYPSSRFEVINNTNVLEIDTATQSTPTALYLATYTSDKGSEDWELLYGLNNFTTAKGGLNFTKHGQAQLSVAEMLTNGAYVLAKRLVSDDATLANVTVKCKVKIVDNVSYVYYYTVSSNSAISLDDACEFGYGSFKPTDDLKETTVAEKTVKEIDIPLFTVVAAGRGMSGLSFRLNPEYVISKSSQCIKYSFETYENTVELVESIMCSMNPDFILDGVNQSLQNKVNNNSSQVKINLYEDGLLKLVSVLSTTAKIGGSPVPVSTLINLDFINGTGIKGTPVIGGIVTNGTDGDLWTSFKPEDITVCNLSGTTGIALVNGSYGKLGGTPMDNLEEYTKLLLGAYGKNTSSKQFDPIIYDLDNYKIDAILDCTYPMEVKNAIVDLVDFRGDCVFLADLGKSINTLDDIIAEADKLTKSKFVAIYHNYFNIINAYTKKEITVTMPYLLISKLTNHIDKGVGIPFAGLANQLSFAGTIIPRTINFLPVIIPGIDQKQKLVDANINYISYYDGVPVMETMYTNDTEYTQLSYLHNIMAIQEIIKIIRTNCPRTRYTFLDGEDLENYIDDVSTLINEYKTNFKSIEVVYMNDEKYEMNNIFYAALKVRFKNFVQEEYFKVIAIN